MRERPTLERTAVGGATLLTLPEPSLPVVRFTFALRHGALADPSGKAGRARVMLELMLRGTRQKSREQWNAALERLGSQVSTSVSPELGIVHGIALKRNLAPTLALIGEALLTPALDDGERTDFVAELTEYLRSERDEDDALAEIFWRRALYLDHPLGRRPAGEPVELATLDGSDIEAAYRAHWQAPGLIVGFAGDITTAEAARAITPMLAGLPGASAASPSLPALPEPEGLRVLIVDKPERTQAQLYVGRLAASGHAPDVDPLWLGVTAFGGTFTSQFTREVRDVRGWSYSAYAEFARRRPWPTPVVLKSAPAIGDVVDCLALELELYQELARGRLAHGAVEFARTYLLNRYPLEVASPTDLLLPAVRNELMGLPPDELFRTPERLEALHPEDVSAALRRYLHPERLVVVMVATAAAVLPALRGRFPGAQVDVVDFRQ